MVEYINKPEYNRAQVYSTKSKDILNYVNVYNTIVDNSGGSKYLDITWMKRVKKNGVTYYYIDVFGKCYANFEESIKLMGVIK